MNKEVDISMKKISEVDLQKPDHDSPPRMPRWVKVSGIIAIVLVLLFVSMHLFGGHGKMGPMHHMSNMNGMKM
jgi:hypothetical protein